MAKCKTLTGLYSVKARQAQKAANPSSIEMENHTTNLFESRTRRRLDATL